MRHLPRQRPGTLQTRGGAKVYRGDLGSQEMLTLTISRYRRRGRTDENLLTVRLVGHFDVYCGNGGEHRERVEVVDLETTTTNGAVAAVWTRDDDEAAATLVSRMVDDALEDWTDPCEDVDPEDETNN